MNYFFWSYLKGKLKKIDPKLTRNCVANSFRELSSSWRSRNLNEKYCRKTNFCANIFRYAFIMHGYTQITFRKGIGSGTGTVIWGFFSASFRSWAFFGDNFLDFLQGDQHEVFLWHSVGRFSPCADSVGLISCRRSCRRSIYEWLWQWMTSWWFLRHEQLLRKGESKWSTIDPALLLFGLRCNGCEFVFVLPPGRTIAKAGTQGSYSDWKWLIRRPCRNNCHPILLKKRMLNGPHIDSCDACTLPVAPCQI